MQIEITLQEKMKLSVKNVLEVKKKFKDKKKRKKNIARCTATSIPFVADCSAYQIL